MRDLSNVSSNAIRFLLFSTHYLQPLALTSQKAATTFSGYRMAFNETIENILVWICFDCYLLIPPYARLNLNFFHRNDIKN